MEVEQQMGFQIGVHTLEDLPLLDIKTNLKKRNNQMSILFPKHMIDTSITIMI